MTSLKMALRSISANKLRAVLTMLGIIIGVIALVVLVSMVDSATNSITQEVSSLGNSQVNVYVYQDRGKSVKLEDLEEFLGRLAAISEIYGPDFVVSISADAEEIGSYVNKYEILNPVE